MVRFIIKAKQILSKKGWKIYIPIWLDLLFAEKHGIDPRQVYLHSNMVRFIIKFCQIDYFRQA